LPVLSKHIVITREFDQEILVAISRTSSIPTYFKNFPQAVVYPLLDLILKDSYFNATTKLIATLDTDLLNYPSRSKIWGLVNPINRTLIKNTAKAYLENLDIHNVAAIEPALKSEITNSETVGWYLGKHKRNIQRALDLFENFDDILERRLQDFLYYYDSEITSIESKRLGELVRDRRWKMCAGIIYSKCKDLSSFRVALNHCFEELSFWDRLAASWNGYANDGRINESDFWSSIHEIACKLFPEGPKQNKVWKEAGGDNSDLLTYGSGKEIWRDALSKLKSGAFQGITVKSLINVMLGSYPNNNDLKFLKKIRKEIWKES
jgi:effector-associated domain 1 (EAD1)-containing protein